VLEELGVLYRGLVLGVVIAAPVGPVGLVCIRRSLQKGLVAGLATGIGAAMADALFAAIAVLGVTAIMDFIHHHEVSIRLVGGVIVLATAWHAWRDTPKPPPNEGDIKLVEKVAHLSHNARAVDFLRWLLSGLVITLTNPLTLFGTLAVVAAFGGITEKLEVGILVGGIFCGSVAWWCLLSGGISLVRDKCSESRIVVINRITAVFLAALAVWAFISGMKALGILP
jgi:threonine/homoserine/homoserine lactone efflux protein